jgi:SAM-dependent methyltransferase
MPKPKKNFEGFAEYYDLIYSNKGYAKEVTFVQRMLTKLGGSVGSMLDLGCGTGRHAAKFARYGWTVTGVDASKRMIDNANAAFENETPSLKSALTFKTGDMRSVRIGRKFDCVLSLFHSIGYQTSNLDLTNSFETAAAHLKTGGLFFFDFWFGPGVLSELPSKRTKIAENPNLTIIRISDPRLDPRRNVVEITFRIEINNKKTGRRLLFTERHRVRYLFLPELEYFLKLSGFEIVASGRWLSTKALEIGNWYGWVAAKKIIRDKKSPSESK